MNRNLLFTLLTTLALVGCSGPSPDFTLEATPSTLAVIQGTDNNYAVKLSRLNGFSGAVQLSVGGLPSGVTASFNANPISDASTLKLQVAAGVEAKEYPITLKGVAGNLNKTLDLKLSVTPAPVTPDFVLSMESDTVEVVHDTDATVPIKITRFNGFSEPINLSVEGAPAGVNVALSPSLANNDVGSLSLASNVSVEPNTYTLTLKATSGKVIKSILFKLIIKASKNDTTPPQVSLAASATQVNSPGNITLTASATDNVYVSKVEFYKVEGGTSIKLGEDKTAPYQLSQNYTASDNGPHTYTAKAYDYAGNSATSSAVMITVLSGSTPPTVSLTASPGSVTLAGSITLTANASDDVGVSKVEFFEGGVKLGEDTTAADGFTHTLNFTAADNGDHTYIAKAFDAEGNTTTSIPTTVNVNIQNPAQPAGSLDLSFGLQGKVFTDFSNSGPLQTILSESGSPDYGTAMVIQPNGKILVAGYSDTNPFEMVTDYDFALVRYNADGSVDTSFGSNGTGQVRVSMGTLNDRATAIALDPDGNIVVVGYVDSNPLEMYVNYDFAVARFTPEGMLDNSFNGTGKLTMGIDTSEDIARAVAVQPNGKIVVAGASYTNHSHNIAVVRYNFDGILDDSFNGTGMQITDVADKGDSDKAYAVAIQPDGKIVVAGHTNDAGDLDFVVLRYTSTGILDNQFGGGDGFQITPLGEDYDSASALALQPDGKIVVVGTTHVDYGPTLEPDDNLSNFILVRYDTFGNLDTAFGNGGIQIGNLPGIVVTANAVALQADGKIVVAGSSDAGSFYEGTEGIDRVFALARYNAADGSPDASFGNGGHQTTTIGKSDSAQALAIQADGKIVLAGFSDTDPSTDENLDFVVVRYNP